jgi:hypothetical protein
VTALNDQDRALLDIESRFWRHQGPKEQAARELGLTPIRYYQRLNALLDSADAWEYAPLAMSRAERLRARIRHRRAA